MIKKFKIYEQLNINLRKKAILYNNRKEMTDIVDKLYELGERTYRSRESLQNSKRLRMFFYFHPGDYAFVRSEDPNILDKLEKMTYGEFMELGGNVKYKKLEGDKSLDPYDEEDWGWEIKNESKFEDLIKKFRKHLIYFKTKEESIEILKHLLEMGEKSFRTVEYIENETEKDATYWRFFEYDSKDGYARSRSEEIESLFPHMTYDEFMKLIGNKKFKKIKREDLDPYDEEDWGWEKIEENTSAFEIIEKLRSSAIRFDNKFEMIEIAKKLIEIGERCFRTVEFLEGSDTYGHSYYRYYNDNGYVRVASLPRGSKIISYKEFMILVGDRKFVKVKNQEIDPYEEEEWGCIYENVLNEIDPYGEEDWDDYTQLLNIWSWDSEYEMMYVTIIDSKWKLDERTVMKKICDLLNIDKYNPLSLNCDAMFFLYRVDNDPPVFIPNDLADEILNLS